MNLNPEQQRKSLLAIQQSLVARESVSVLIVDDSVNDAEITSNQLALHGIQTSIAPSGDVAFQMVQSNGFVVVFLDWRLIGRSGLETLKQIKRASQGCSVIVLTGVATDQDVGIALENGAAAVMSKPLTDEQIELIFGLPNKSYE